MVLWRVIVIYNELNSAENILKPPTAPIHLSIPLRPLRVKLKLASVTRVMCTRVHLLHHFQSDLPHLMYQQTWFARQPH